MNMYIIKTKSLVNAAFKTSLPSPFHPSPYKNSGVGSRKGLLQSQPVIGRQSRVTIFVLHLQGLLLRLRELTGKGGRGVVEIERQRLSSSDLGSWYSGFDSLATALLVTFISSINSSTLVVGLSSKVSQSSPPTSLWRSSFQGHPCWHQSPRGQHTQLRTFQLEGMGVLCHGSC